MKFENITVVNIDGRPGETIGAQRAIAKSSHELPGSKKLLISPSRPKKLLDGIEHIQIKPLGYFEYGLFVLYALHNFITTDYVLIVQDDGWVLDGRQWKDIFFEYDYIGAPIHFARVTTIGAEKYLRGFEWTNFLGSTNCKIDLVLNGGFSLRSKRLLEAPQQLNIPYTIPAISNISGPPFKMCWESDAHLEDVYLSLTMRPQLEESGIKFAPLEVAKYFSFEHLHPAIHKNINLMEILGHHAKIRKLRGQDFSEIEYSLRINEASSILGESLAIDLFKRRGYSIKFSH